MPPGVVKAGTGLMRSPAYAWWLSNDEPDAAVLTAASSAPSVEPGAWGREGRSRGAAG